MARHLGGLNGLLLPVGVILCLSAFFGNTLAQDLTSEQWQQCSGYPAIGLEEIRPDGQVLVRYSDPSNLAAYHECMRKAAAQQAPRGKAVRSGAEPATPPTLQPPGAPEWRRGYEWAFRWESPRGKGMFVWSVDRIETVAGTEFYVIKGGNYETYWRRSDLAHLMDRNSERNVVDRFTPPQTGYVWPLTVGKSWEQTYSRERPAARTVDEVTMSCAVGEQEKVTVAAGVFDTFRIECRNKRTGRVMFRRWYSPAVSNVVREEGFFDYGKRERELIAFRIPQGAKTRAVSVTPDASMALTQNDSEAASSLHKAADAGDGRAMAKLGFMYFAGQGGLRKDDRAAVRWFRKGAATGDGLAKAFLGASYWTGLGALPKDEAEAVRWFRKGVDAGDGRAMAMLGQAYSIGAGGLAKNEAEAARWLRSGADAGDGRAMAMLGEMYLTGGGGLPRDDVAAVRWIRRAADAGDGFAMATLGRMCETGEGGIAKDEAAAVRWYRRGAVAGNGRAMAGLGGMYSTGRGGLTKNEAEAVRWYREGVDLLDAVAMFQLGQAYEAGRGVAQDRQEAARWYERAASFGSPDAFDRLVALGGQP